MARKKRLKIALIGYGAISQTLFDLFREKKPDIDIIGVLVRPGRAKETRPAWPTSSSWTTCRGPPACRPRQQPLPRASA